MNSHFFVKFALFALIPLILTIGLSPSLQNNFLPEADALKSKGNSMTEIGSKKVCGAQLCSEKSSHQQMKQSHMTHSSSMNFHHLMKEMDKVHEKHQNHMLQKWNSLNSEEQSKMYHMMQQMVEKMNSMDMNEHMKMMSKMHEKHDGMMSHGDKGHDGMNVSGTFKAYVLTLKK